MENLDGINGDNRGNNFCLVRPVFVDKVLLKEKFLYLTLKTILNRNTIIEILPKAKFNGSVINTKAKR